jgi:hypothetical protein
MSPVGRGEDRSATGAGPVVVVRSADRFRAPAAGVVSRHSFSFGSHYDAGNVGFGLLVVSNEDLVQPGVGYGTHPHRDVEIVTWVLDGALAHRDSTGAGGTVYPGLVQRMSAGSGVLHSESNAPGAAAPLHFVQMWILPDTPGGEPSYEQCDVSGAIRGGGLVPVASGMARHRGLAAVTIGQRNAAMHVAAPRPDVDVCLPAAPFVHAFVTRGRADVEGVGLLGEGDAVRLSDEGGRRLRAADGGCAEVVVWEMHATVGRT